jgi:hypothetical protein
MTATLEPPVRVRKKATRQQLFDLIEKMQRDWVQLNVYMNGTAVAHSWCGSYEDRQQRYNQGFEVLKLQGRPDRGMARGKDYYLLPDEALEALRIMHVVTKLEYEGDLDEVAEAIWRRRTAAHGHTGLRWEGQPQSTRDHYRILVRQMRHATGGPPMSPRAF